MSEEKPRPMLVTTGGLRCPKCGGTWLLSAYQYGRYVSQCMGDECDWWGSTADTRPPQVPS